MQVLAIESSCDDTAVALYATDRGLLFDTLHTQSALHGGFGGVVPELAARDHAAKCAPMVLEALAHQGLALTDLDGICYTCGPGLAGALMVGACMGQTLAEVLGIPGLGVNHLEGHVMAVFLEEKHPPYPFLALLVSGGHTQLVQVNAFGCYQTLAETRDDAVGEAFDKTAKILGLGYPGGAQLAALADTCKQHDLRFPRPMTDRPGLDFSFSGLKTHVATMVSQHAGMDDVNKAAIAAAFQEAVVETLVIKCKRALQQTGLEHMVLCGGVAANTALRHGLSQLCETVSATLHCPRQRYCTDNAAMIAYVGHQRLLAGECSEVIDIRPRYPLEDLQVPV